MAKKAPSRGGKRRGAGRKPAPAGTQRIMLSIKLKPIVMDYLATCDNKTATIESLLEASEGFQSFLQAKTVKVEKKV